MVMVVYQYNDILNRTSTHSKQLEKKLGYI